MIALSHGNNKDVTERTIREQRAMRLLAVGHKSTVEDVFTVVENVTPRQRYDEGFQAYVRGASIADLEGDTVAELGWWLANSAEAANDMLEWERAKEIDAAQGEQTMWWG